MAKTTGYLSNSELSMFCSNLAIILKSGISAVEGITILREDAETGKAKEVMSKLSEKMSETGRLDEAMEATGAFPPYAVKMTKIGEESGRLDEVMEGLDAYYQREESIRQSMRNALVYPLIMTGMMLVVILVLLIYVMPVFNRVFQDLGASMSGFSLMLLNLGKGIRKYAIVIVIVVLVLLVLALLSVFTETGRRIRYNLGSGFTAIKKNREDIAACRFASVMSMMLKSGLHPEQSIELVEELNDDPAFATKLSALKKDLADGDDFAESLHKENIFTGTYAKLAAIGSKAGVTDQVLEKIATLYQNTIDTRLSNRMAVIEPTLVIILSVLVGAILLSVMFPLLGIMSTM